MAARLCLVSLALVFFVMAQQSSGLLIQLPIAF